MRKEEYEHFYGMDRRKGIQEDPETIELEESVREKIGTEEARAIAIMESSVKKILEAPERKLPIGVNGIITAAFEAVASLDDLVKTNVNLRRTYKIDELLSDLKLLQRASKTNDPGTVKEAAAVLKAALDRIPR